MKNKSVTIALYGIGGVYNYGCEAIIRGTEIIIHEIWPSANIKYASLRAKDDERRLKGCDVEIIPRKIYKLGLVADHLNKLMASKTGLFCQKTFKENFEWVEECDAIFSIGGDLYTLPPYYKDPKKRYCNPLISFGNFVKSRGKKFVIWGASIGPFEGYPKAKKVFIDHLRQADLITSREPVTTNYLKNLGIKNVTEYADPAFAISNQGIDKKHLGSGRLHIGINLSPLSSAYIFKTNLNDVIKKQADVITSLIKNFDAQVTLIPHVVCNFNSNDDDLRYLRLVKSQIGTNFIDHVNLIQGDLGFLETKKILSTCDVVIAARMHCAINAISIDVPTIFLAYSKKAYGMAEYVYGNDKWVVPLNDFKTSSFEILINKIISENKEPLKRLNYHKDHKSNFYEVVESVIS